MARKDEYPTPPAETVHNPERADKLVRIANDALNRLICPGKTGQLPG